MRRNQLSHGLPSVKNFFIRCVCFCVFLCVCLWVSAISLQALSKKTWFCLETKSKELSLRNAFCRFLSSYHIAEADLGLQQHPRWSVL